MIYRETCKICNEVFESDVKFAAKGNLSKHIVKVHNITVSEYLLDGKSWPLCKCGCGNKVGYSKMVFNQYYKDHKNRMPQTDEVKSKIICGLKDVLYKKIKEGKIDIELFKSLWERYKNNPNDSLEILSKESGFDKRTITNYWYKLGIAGKKEIKRQSRKHKFIFSNQGDKNGQFCFIEEYKLEKIFNDITENKNKLTLGDLRIKYSISFSNHVLLKRLFEKYGKDVIKGLLKIRRSSNVSIEEATFGNVLVFYFGEKNVRFQFKIKYVNKNGRRTHKFYDYCLFEKILIEYDGLYWHNNEVSKINDDDKEKLAIENGFILFRVKSSEAKNIEILQKIKELACEIQVKKS